MWGLHLGIHVKHLRQSLTISICNLTTKQNNEPVHKDLLVTITSTIQLICEARMEALFYGLNSLLHSCHGTSLPRGNASSSILLANHLLCFTHPTPFHPDLFFPKVFPLLKKLNSEISNRQITGDFLGRCFRKKAGVCPVPALVILKARQEGYSFFFSICLGISEYWPNTVRTLWGHKGMWMEALDTCLVEALLHCDPDQTTETILFLSFSSCAISQTARFFFE